MSAALLAACGDPPPLPTLKGPERTDLVDKLRGTIVWEHPVGGLMGMELPTGEELMVRPFYSDDGGPRQEYPDSFVQTVGGPDQSGRVVYVEKRLSVVKAAESFFLKTIRVDGGADRELGHLPAATLKKIGDVLAVAPQGGRAALLTQTDSAMLSGRPFYIAGGTLEVWDIAAGKRLRTIEGAIDMGLSWFPDGLQLAYVAPVPAAEVVADQRGKFAQAAEVPAIHVLTVDSGDATRIVAGTDPLVSTDGTSMLYVGPDRFYRTINLASGESRKVNLPGQKGEAIGFVDGRYVIYGALPTAGAPVVRSKYGSFRAGLQMITIKVTDIDGGGYQTVVPAIDGRWSASFGAAAQPAEPGARNEK